MGSITNRICVFKDGHRRYIDPSQLELYLNDGYEKTYKTKEYRVVDKLALRISYEDLYNYYETENHTKEETVEFFEINKGQLNDLLSYYKIIKSTSSRATNSKKGKLKKYGDENYNNREKASETCRKNHGVDWPCLTQQCREEAESRETRNKAIETYKNKTGKKVWNEGEVGVETWLPDTGKKRYETMKRNNSFNKSGPEEKLELLLHKLYGKEDVKRWYISDPRYKHECDFYVKSKDLFIELNCHWTHGKHPFNPKNKDDILILNEWRSKQGYLKNGKKNSYFIAEEVWTIRDVEKSRDAKKNKLNYIVFYTDNEEEWYDTLSKESIL